MSDNSEPTLKSELLEGKPLIKPSSTNHILYEEVVLALKTVFDPEIPVNIYDLGLIYNIEVKNENEVAVEMTLTSPNCPVAESLPRMVKENINAVEGVNKVNLKLVWTPPWTKEMMSEEAKLELNL